jgi:hypothetical protein
MTRPGTEKERRVEHVVRQAYAGCHGDQVAGKQRQLHPRLALGDAVAHGRHAAGNLRDATGFRCRRADNSRIGLERLMGRKHVVIRRDDPEIGHAVARKSLLLGGGTDGEAMGQIGASKHAALGAL